MICWAYGKSYSGFWLSYLLITHSNYLSNLQVRNLFEEKKVEMLVDRDLKGCFNTEELEKTVEVALQCTQSNPNNRPKMSEVLRILEDITGQMGHVDESQVGSNICETRAFSFSRNFSDIHEESSFTIEPIELSGPR